MTIESISTEGRTVTIQLNPGGVNVSVFDDRGHGVLGATVTPEGFAREVAALNIPGLTVTYEPPFEKPTEPGLYVLRRNLDNLGAGPTIYRLSPTNGWRVGVMKMDKGNWAEVRANGGLVRLVPEQPATPAPEGKGRYALPPIPHARPDDKENQ